ncbi:PAS domain S-box protein [Halosimplex litoreum]|uniref:histidine kinase n=1 Tax=Halosimplex litoreum TaxID=1198301 RepID=A0A7T3KTW9_9EURY|nr:PAS domain S-box protein [Halosimplex litoreum]QPV61619.1 PAS domain S-box protein [Halosimplex litoreum]
MTDFGASRSVDREDVRIRVLHVDDEPDLADLASTFVEREDERFTVETAASASEGLERLDEAAFDCIVSDYEMPGRNGIAFLETVRSEYPELPFILYTGKGSEEVASDAISAGVTDYLQKGSGTSQYTVLANRIANAVEQYRSKRELETSRERLSLFFDQSPLGVIEWNDDFEVARINERAEAILGYGADDLVGDSWERIVPDSDREPVGNVVSNLLRDEDGYHSINTNVRRDGERIVCEWHNRVVTDDDGETVAVFSQFQDITDRKAREPAGELETRVMDEAPVGITLSDPSRDDNPLVYANDRFEQLTGYTESEVLGRNCRFLQGERTAGEPVAAMRTAIDAGDPVTVELRNYREDGTEFWNRVSIAPVRTSDGEITNYVGFQRDVTGEKERELQLERKERRFQAIFDDPNILVGLIDTDGTVLDINRTAMEYVAATREELIGQPFWATPWFDHSEAVQRAVEGWIDRAADGEYVEFEADLVGPTGEPYTVEGVFRPVTNDDGEVVSLLVSDRDITERKRRERELRQYEAYLEESSDIVTVLDEAGTITYQSPAVERILGYETDALVGRNGFGYVHPDDEDEVREAFSDLVAGPEEMVTVECRFRTADDAWRWLEIRGTNRLDHDAVEGIVTNNWDITGRIEREQELEETNALLSTLIETFPVGVLAEDESRNVLMVNDRLLELFDTSRAPDEVIGTDCERLAAELGERFVDPERFVARIADLVDRRDSVRDEEVSLRDGRTFARSYEPIELPDGFGHLWVYRDITDRKDREQALTEERDRLDEFASVVSHDLRNPLNVAQGRLKFVQRECDTEHLEAIATALHRIERITEDVLWLAREGRDIGALTPVALDAAIDDAWTLVTDDVAHAELRRATDGDPLPPIEADDDRLYQLLENLFGNAVEHGGQDVVVTVGALEDGFYVEDDGPGIPEGERDDIFDAGYSTRETGTGFGLNIVEQIAEAHGWDISVTEGADGGVRFAIRGVVFAAE